MELDKAGLCCHSIGSNDLENSFFRARIACGILHSLRKIYGSPFIYCRKEGTGGIASALCGYARLAEMAATVSRVYEGLSAEERAKCVVFAQNYGEAGAISFLRKEFDLPSAISGHNNYWLWGPGDVAAEVVIVLGGNTEDHEAVFESVELADMVRCRYCMPYENNLPVFVGRKMKVPIRELGHS